MVESDMKKASLPPLTKNEESLRSRPKTTPLSPILWYNKNNKFRGTETREEPQGKQEGEIWRKRSASDDRIMKSYG